MLVDFLTLGLAPDADDEEIRKRYLALIRRFPPEKDAAHFQAVTTAYERIKDESTRLRTALFGPLEITDTQQALNRLVRAASPGRRQAGLKPIMDSVAAGGGKRPSTKATMPDGGSVRNKSGEKP